MSRFHTNLAKNLRALRGDNQTQAAFARKVGVDQASINRIEQGLQNVTLATLNRICDRLKVTAGELLDG